MRPRQPATIGSFDFADTPRTVRAFWPISVLNHTADTQAKDADATLSLSRSMLANDSSAIDHIAEAAAAAQ